MPPQYCVRGCFGHESLACLGEHARRREVPLARPMCGGREALEILLRPIDAAHRGGALGGVGCHAPDAAVLAMGHETGERLLAATAAQVAAGGVDHLALEEVGIP